MEKIIDIPKEYQPLFSDGWREAAVYGGRFCFTGETLVATNHGYKRLDSLVVGNCALTKEGVFDKITSVDSFEADYDPKPMLKIKIDGIITNTTFDHKYFDGKTYVPIYQLVWGIMDASQRRTLELLCEQYGKDTHNELQGWLQNRSNEASDKPFGVLNDCGWKENSTCTQNNCENIYPKSKEQGYSESQERNQDRQSSGEHGVGDEKRAVKALVGYRTSQGCTQNGQQFQESNGKRSERVVAISLRPSDDANTNDGRGFERNDWAELRWDTGFAQWQNVDTPTIGISTQEAECVGGSQRGIEVVGVTETTKVWCITTEKYHNYFANGVNVSNSLKSHTVARYLLIQARMKKTRVACFREFQNSIADSSHQLLADLIRQYELTDFDVTNNSIVNTINGSDFLFKGLHNNEQSVKSTEGIDIAWVEEAQTISRNSLEILTPTIRSEGSKIIYTYNRLLEDDPVHQRLVIEGRPNTLIINVNYDIALKYNMMPDVVRLEMEDDKARRPSLYKHKWLGEPNSLERKIYRDWAFVEEIPHEARLERRWLDFGYTNDPTAIGSLYYYNGGYILDEEVYQKGLSNKQIADILKNLPRNSTMVVADSAEPKSIDEIRLYGVNIQPAVKGKDSILYGINMVQDQKMSVTKRSVNIIKEYNNYLFIEDKEGRILNEPEGGFDHHLDGIRYAVTSLIPVIQRQDMIANAPRWANAVEPKNPAR